MLRPLSTSALALIVGAAPAFADLTPAQVWDSLQAQYSTYGSTVTTGAKDEAGDTLTVTDIVVAWPKSEDGQGATVTIPKMVLQQTGDARVRTVVEGDVLFAVDGQSADGETMDMAATLSLPDNELVSSGTPEDITHDVVYPSLAITVQMDEGDADNGTVGPLTMTLTDLKGREHIVTGDKAETTYDMTAARLDLQMAANTTVDPADEPAETDPTKNTPDGIEPDAAQDLPQKVETTAQVQNLAFSGQMTAPKGGIDPDTPINEALSAGLAFQGRFSTGQSQTRVNFDSMDEDGNARTGYANFGSDGSKLAVSMSADGLTYDGSTANARGDMSIPDVPFPISYVIEAASGRLSLPLSARDTPQPFTLRYAVAGVTIADGIWDLFDPQKTLPRDPASMTVDTEGTVVLDQDLLDPALSKKMEDAAARLDQNPDQPTQAPNAATDQTETATDDTSDAVNAFHPETMKINKIAVSAVGADADFSGDLKFGEDPTQPVGQINGTFNGVNALLDKLASVGLIPQDQMMAARMMLPMFAKPVEGNPEQMKTAIEFRDGGSVYVNGQQVK